MFTPIAFIDTIQGMKRTAANQLIKDTTLNQSAHAFIDAQTEFAKMLVTNTMTMVNHSVETASKSVFSKKA